MSEAAPDTSTSPSRPRPWRVYRLPAVLQCGGRWLYTTSPLIRWSSNLPFLELCLPHRRRDRQGYTPYLKMYALLNVGDASSLTVEQKRLLVDLHMAGIRARDWVAAHSLRFCLFSSIRAITIKRILSRMFGACVFAGLTLACYHPGSFQSSYTNYGFGDYVLLFCGFWALFVAIFLIDNVPVYYRPPGWLPATPDEEAEGAGEKKESGTILDSLKKVGEMAIGCVLVIFILGLVLGGLVALFLGGGYLLYWLIRNFLPPERFLPILAVLAIWGWTRRKRVRQCLRGNSAESIRERLENSEVAYRQFILELMEESGSWEAE